MTQPNYSPPDVPRHAVRRFVEGRKYTPLNPEIRDAFLTILAKGLRKFEIGVGAWSLMSNHMHLFVFDLNLDGASQIGPFRRFLNSVFARWLNDFWDRKGVVFDPSSVPQDILIVDVSREIEVIAYIENNPVKAGLVWDLESLDGSTSCRSMLFEPLTVPRPEYWFREKRWPEVAEISLGVPPSAQLAGHDRQSWFECTSHAVETSRHVWMRFHIELGNGFAGLEAFSEGSPDDIGEQKEGYVRIPFTGNDQVALARAYLARRRFRRRYARCFQSVKDGEPDIVFPRGTDQMVNTFGHQISAEVAAKSG